MANLEDGNQTLVISARDYRGNEMSQTVTFMVDNTAPVPRPVVSRFGNNNNDDNNDNGNNNNFGENNNDAGGNF